VAGSLWFWDAPLEHHADPVVTPLHVVAPWYLSWSQGWLKLGDKMLVVGFIPLLLVAFIVMPYFEVGKSRRYANRRVGLSVAMLFIAFMLVSNWMGSPEYAVESSPDIEVATKILPEEGVSSLLGVPPDSLVNGAFLPGQVIEGNPHMTYALQVFAEQMALHSCTNKGSAKIGGIALPACVPDDNKMPDPYAELNVEPYQGGLRKLTVHIEAEDPQNVGGFLYLLDWEGFRHDAANYEEECTYINKSC
jgi:hypothetical protein